MVILYFRFDWIEFNHQMKIRYLQKYCILQKHKYQWKYGICGNTVFCRKINIHKSPTGNREFRFGSHEVFSLKRLYFEKIIVSNHHFWDFILKITVFFKFTVFLSIFDFWKFYLVGIGSKKTHFRITLKNAVEWY